MTLQEIKDKFCGKIVQEISTETPNPNPVFGLIDTPSDWHEDDVSIDYSVYVSVIDQSKLGKYTWTTIYDKVHNQLLIEEYSPCPGKGLSLTSPVTLESFNNDLDGLVVKPHGRALPIEIKKGMVIKLNYWYGLEDGTLLYEPLPYLIGTPERGNLLFDVVDSCPIEAMSSKKSLLDALEANKNVPGDNIEKGDKVKFVYKDKYLDTFNNEEYRMIGLAEGGFRKSDYIIVEHIYASPKSITYFTISEWGQINEDLSPRFLRI